MARGSWRLKRGVCCFLFALVSAVAWGQAPGEVVVRIDGRNAVTRADFDSAVYMAARQRFYHGRVDDKRLQALRAEVLGELVDRQLLLEEAKAQGLKPAADVEERHYQRLRRSYNLAALPASHRGQIEKELRRRSAEQALVDRLETKVKAVGKPAETDLKLFYRQNLDKFTTPPRLRVSVILLTVAPSAPATAWKAAQEEAGNIRGKIQNGASFADLARLHSGDPSANNGGDLGFVHQGMLSRDAQQAIDKLELGEVSAPVALLQGVALFKVDQRQEAKVNPLEQVRERARGLWQREQAGKAWQSFLQSLRAKAKIEIMNSKITAAMIWTQRADVVQK
jgi:parvulin-like peptidyl-prolyl isomerase